MSSRYGPMQVIVNPRAGKGAVERGWPAVQVVLRDEDLEHEVAFTEDVGHATQLAREAIDHGCRFIVAVGGDGTLNEVVNGMMGEDGPIEPEAVLGVVAAGSGSDFVRTFGLSQDPGEAAKHLTGKTLWGTLDIGRVRFRAPDGSDASRWFVNIAEAGIGAKVVEMAARMPRWLGARAYRIGALRGIASFKPTDATIVMNGRKARGVRKDSPLEDVKWAGPLTMLVVANCQFFGGGLRVAPRAIPSDAMLDVLIGHGSKWQAIQALKRMPRGEHVPNATIEELLADMIRLETTEPIPIEADGEWLGTTPATFELHAGAIPLKI